MVGSCCPGPLRGGEDIAFSGGFLTVEWLEAEMNCVGPG